MAQCHKYGTICHKYGILCHTCCIFCQYAILMAYCAILWHIVPYLYSNSLFYRLRCQRTRAPHTISSHPISPALFSPHPISSHPISSHPISHPQTSTEWVAELVAKSTPHANAMMKSCHAVFKLCGTMLQPLFDANNEGRDYCLQVTRLREVLFTRTLVSAFARRCMQPLPHPS